MSRARHQESLNAVQLFPFVAVLLCTMGSLLVLLVAVSRTSRVQAEQRVAEAKAEAKAQAVNTPPVDDALRARLDKARQHLAVLKQQEALVKAHLQNDQLQLSHLEDHMRRLQTELESLRTGAAEMNSLEKTHFDDREQAQRELARLGELVEDRKKAIAELKKELGNRRAYAIIPFKSPGGTHRPPVYFECKKDLIILQPEEIRLTWNDFRGPLGSGTPITAAFRAAREHIVRQSGNSPPDEAAEPYALVIIRPQGRDISAFLLENFDKAGISFGYELIESDAEIRYPPADPRLLADAFQAVETARGRIASLAIAAPHIYDHFGDHVDDFNPEDYEQSDSVASTSTGDTSKRSGHNYAIVASNAPDSPAEPRPSGDNQDDEEEYVSVVPTGVRSTRKAPATAASSSEALAAQGGSGGQGAPSGFGGKVQSGTITGFGPMSGGARPSSSVIAPGGTIQAAKSNVTGTSGGSGPASGRQGSGSNAGGSSLRAGDTPGTSAGNAKSGAPALAGEPEPPGVNAAAVQAGANATGSTGLKEFGNYNPHATPTNEKFHERLDFAGDEAHGRTNTTQQLSDNAGEKQINAPEEDHFERRRQAMKVRGKNWAIRNRKPDSVPLRRTIHVEIKGDQLAIRAEHGANDEAGTGRKIPLAGPTFDAREDISDALEQHIKAWGMAGEGLYWRPVIEVSVSADGEGRAEDLAMMLKNSGIELKTAAVAHHSEGEASNASR